MTYIIKNHKIIIFFTLKLYCYCKKFKVKTPFLVDTGLTLVSFGASSLIGHGLTKVFKNSFSVDIDSGRLQGKWASAAKSLQSCEGPRKKARAIWNQKYVKNTMAIK